MFNPQRKSKVSDIYMQQKWYQMHMSKIRDIAHSSSPLKQRQKQQQQQQKYLKRLSLSKKQVQERYNSQVKKSNHKLFLKLLDTDNRKQINPEVQYFKNKKKHFNSYFSSKKQIERVKVQNFTMVARMMNSLSDVPTLSDCKLQHKRNKRYQRKCRKLPSIFQHENQYKKKFSKRYLQQSHFKSRVASSRFSHLKLSQPNLQERQKQLISKQISRNNYSKNEDYSEATKQQPSRLSKEQPSRLSKEQ